MKKLSKQQARNLEERRWVQLLTVLAVVAVLAVCSFVVWRAVEAKSHQAQSTASTKN